MTQTKTLKKLTSIANNEKNFRLNHWFSLQGSFLKVTSGGLVNRSNLHGH